MVNEKTNPKAAANRFGGAKIGFGFNFAISATFPENVAKGEGKVVNALIPKSNARKKLNHSHCSAIAIIVTKITCAATKRTTFSSTYNPFVFWFIFLF